MPITAHRPPRRDLAEGHFGGEWANAFPFGMAAAYAYHLSRNHAFIDGNKRVGLSAAVVFLYMNG